MTRTINFYAGPSILPVEVFEKIAAEMVDYQGTGLSLMETSHRSKTYDDVHNTAVSLLKELLSIPDNYKILFLGGGAGPREASSAYRRATPPPTKEGE